MILFNKSDKTKRLIEQISPNVVDCMLCGAEILPGTPYIRHVTDEDKENSNDINLCEKHLHEN